MTTLDPRYAPVAYQTAYEQAPRTFVAACPSCHTDCTWTASPADGSVPTCPCTEETAA